jgi:tripartite-type tricarboxylate transporter receptor subunit TctC
MGTHASAVALYPKLPYYPVTDFEPIGLVVNVPVVVFARKNLPAQSLKELASYGRMDPGRLTMAHAGVGSVSFTACLLLNSMLGVKATPVAYNGTRPAISALGAGQIDYMCDQVANGVVEFGRGSVKALAVASGARNPVLPGVPTAGEAGLAEFEVTAWSGLFAPKGTPQPILDRLTDALDQALDDEATRKRLIELGCDIPGATRRGQQALTRLVKSEIERWKTTLGELAPPPGQRAESFLRALN